MKKNNDVKETYLFPWFEAVGTYHGLSVNDCYVHLKISDKTLSFPTDSNEVKHLRDRLDDSLIGSKIGILKTDIREKPIRIRLID